MNTSELKKKVCLECGQEYYYYDFTIQDDICDYCVDEKLKLINTLMPKVKSEDIDIDEYCNYVYIVVDDEVKNVFSQCGITEEKFNKNIEDNKIDLNIIGFKYGKWFVEDEGYSETDMS